MSLHLSDDQLVDRLYGLSKDADDPHLSGCESCQARWRAFHRRREQAAAAPLPTPEFLHRQRRAIQARLETPQSNWSLVWVPATAAAVLIAGFVFTRPGAAPVLTPEPRIAAVDAGWFEDTYSAMRDLEPRAASPIRGLFAEPVQE